MKTILLVLQIIISVLLVLAVLTQQRGSGLSATFGGSGGFYTSKRGAEKFLSIFTIILAILFVGNSIAFLFFY
ncbi:preprotein translocase subunit SecG [Candidatus Peregrinibacteria bacterium]|nr:preprotein translocase subunit SecG [Candidatus Peregrinibacteria bacterium]